jgi:hypothetical protein
MAAMDKLVKLMQLQKMMDDSAYRKQKYNYDMEQDRIRNENANRTYTLQKLVNERSQASAKKKLEKEAAKREFNQDYTAILPDIMEYNKDDKAGFLSDMREFGQEYSEVPQNFMKDSLKMYEDVQGDAYKPPNPTRQSQYVVSEFVSKYGRPPNSPEEWASAEAIAYSDDPERGTWQDRLQKYSNISIGEQTNIVGRDEDDLVIKNRDGSLSRIPIGGSGHLVKPQDEVLPQASQDTLTQGLRGIEVLNKMGDLTEDVLSDTPVWSRLSGWGQKAKLWAGAGTDAEEAYKTYTDSLMMLSQSFIKGTPSDFDVKTFAATIPGFGTDRTLAKKKIKQAKEMLSNEIKNQLSYYKGSNKPVPFHIIQAAEKLGVGFSGVEGDTNPWDNDTATGPKRIRVKL